VAVVAVVAMRAHPHRAPRQPHGLPLLRQRRKPVAALTTWTTIFRFKGLGSNTELQERERREKIPKKFKIAEEHFCVYDQLSKPLQVYFSYFSFLFFFRVLRVTFAPFAHLKSAFDLKRATLLACATS
jgi:hypothetical protein